MERTKKTLFSLLGIICASMFMLGCSKSDSGDISVASVSLNKTSLEIAVGESATLVATLQPEDATNFNVAWSSDNSSVATVDESGKVTAVKEGTATITVTTQDGGKTASCVVTVVTATVPVKGITLNKTTLSLDEYKSEKLIATVQPEDATNKTVVWSSSDEKVATVDKDGTVKGVYAGTANIIATTESGEYKAICKVSVDADVTSKVNQTFRAALKKKGYIANETKVMRSELLKITYLNISGTSSTQKGSVTSLLGIELFDNLEILYAGCNNITGTFTDLSRNAKLKEIDLSYNGMTGITLGANNYNVIILSNNSLRRVSAETGATVKQLDISYNTPLATNMVSLDLTSVELLGVSGMNLYVLNMQAKNLKTLFAEDNKLSVFNAALYPNLEELYLEGNATMKSLALDNPKLKRLGVADCALTGLDISTSTGLTHLTCSGNPGSGGNFVVNVWNGFVRQPNMPNDNVSWTYETTKVTLRYILK